MFTGIDCAQQSWKFISAAAQELWGITTGLYFSFGAACSNVAMFSHTVINTDVLRIFRMVFMIQPNHYCTVFCFPVQWDPTNLQ